MRTFTALLVDDELAGLRTLEAKIEWSNFPIKIIGKVNSVQRAIPIILEFKPDLVFLDIKMPDQDGFSLFKHLDTTTCDVIFTTAHEEFALKAFKHQASGYLLKPISQRELNPLLEDIIGKRGLADNHTVLASFKSHGNIIQLNQSEISHVISDGIKSQIFTTRDEKHEVSYHLKKVENELDQSQFHRIHHQTIVNITHIAKIIKGRNACLQMNNGAQLEISRSRKIEFYQKFNEFSSNLG